MNKIVKVFIILILALIFISATNTDAGVLASLDEELTGLVRQARPFMVTVESRDNIQNNVFIGTGVLIDKAGYILTTTSIISDSDAVKVVFNGGDEFAAEIVGSDQHTGLALLKIEPVERNLPIFGDPYSLKEGSWIIVIGNSYDMPNSVNFGVFSGLTDKGFLQLSAQSSPGSSGSAVFNTKGEMVGLLVGQGKETISVQLPVDNFIKVKTNGYKISPPQISSGIGIDIPSAGISLAVPIDKLKRVSEQLKLYGEVEHGFLGIKQKHLNEKRRQQVNIDGGVQVTAVSKDSPADKAGIAKGDIIVEFDGKKVKGPGHLYSLVRSYLPDEKVKMDLIRDTTTISVTVTLGQTNNNGSFGFRQNSDLENQFGFLSSKELANKINLAKKETANLNSDLDKADLKLEFEELNDRIRDLERDFKELSAKFNELTKEFKK